MRRLLLFSLALMALLGFVAPPDVLAQAAAPKPNFTITGFIDTVGTYSRNVSNADGGAFNRNDKQGYGRSRGRFDITGEVGQAKAVFGFELDEVWGQTGSTNSTFPTTASAASTTPVANQFGTDGSFGLNTDVRGQLEVKWLYVEFPAPLIPVPMIVRLGAQPFATASSYKLATYANGDFAGVNLYATISPTFKTQFTFVKIDEQVLGKGAQGVVISGAGSSGDNKCITNTGALTTNCNSAARNDNWAIIGSPEITVMKGLDIKPMLSTAFITGLTTTQVRQGRGGVSTNSGGPFAPTASGFAGADGVGTGVHEKRHTVGIDARWRSGPWSVDPSVYYQFGTQAKWNPGGVATAYGTANTRQSADISAWLGDIRASYQLGPLLLSAMTMWTTGQDAKSNPYRSIKYYTPLDTDTSYLADWGTQIMSLGIDYYQIIGAGQNNPGVEIGWDKYGRVAFGAKASYAWTPALTVGFGVQPNWTWNKVDTDAYLVSGGGLQPSFVCRKTGQSCRPEGESNYLGTEIDASLTYRFAPGLAFDFAAGYMFAGNALSHRYIGSDYNAGAGAPVGKDIGVNDIAIITSRVRFSF